MDGRGFASSAFWEVARLLPLRLRRGLLYRIRHGRWPNLAEPTLFSEKMQVRILRDRRPVMASLGDKAAMKEFAAGHSDVEIPRTVWFGTDLNELELLAGIPDRWVLKPNHGSNYVIFGEGAPDVADLRRRTRGWLTATPPLWKYQGEWVYSQARVGLILEERIGGQTPPEDYKFFVFDGRPAFIQLDTARFTGHARTLYSPDWEPLEVRNVFPVAKEHPRPAALDRMLKIAAQLGAGIDFVRVDLYCVGDTVWFGELSPCAGGGLEPYEPLDFDRAMGDAWRQTVV